MILYDLTATAGQCPDRLLRLRPALPVGVPRAWLAPIGVPYPTTTDEATLSWRLGLDGLRYATIGDPPPVAAWALVPGPRWPVPVEIEPYGRLAIEPAIATGFEIDLLAGTVSEQPASRYGRLVRELLDRYDAGEQPPAIDRGVLAVAVAAIQTGYRLSEEAIQAYPGLVTTSSVWRWVEAAYAVPKAASAVSG